MPDFSDSTAATPVGGQVHGFHPAHLDAAIRDVAAGIEPGGFREFHRHGVLADTEQLGGQVHELQGHEPQCDKRDHGKDGQLDLDPSV